MQIYVVTNVERGWNCVCGAFKSITGLKDFFAHRIQEFRELSEQELKDLSFDDFEAVVNETAYVISETELQD